MFEKHRAKAQDFSRGEAQRPMLGVNGAERCSRPEVEQLQENRGRPSVPSECMFRFAARKPKSYTFPPSFRDFPTAYIFAFVP